MIENSNEKYRIELEAVVYNFPIDKELEFNGYRFYMNAMPESVKEQCRGYKKVIHFNTVFFDCCYTFENELYYTTIKDNSLEIEGVEDTELLDSLANDVITQYIRTFEKRLCFVTNRCVFAPLVDFKIVSGEGKEIAKAAVILHRPHIHSLYMSKYDNIKYDYKNLTMVWKDFEKFIEQKNHSRYKRAHELYIKSFYQSDPTASFILLCAAIDAITGKNDGNLTKDRLAKYASVLLCDPKNYSSIKEQLKKMYSTRSKVAHGKCTDIPSEEVDDLRYFTWLFLLTYYHFWLELGIKHEFEFLQKMDLILDGKKKYMDIVPITYSFLANINNIVKNKKDFFILSQNDKLQEIIKIINDDINYTINDSVN